MRNRIIALFFLLAAPAALAAQQPVQPGEENKPTLQQRLMPDNTVKLIAPAPTVATTSEEQPAQPMMQRRGSGVGLMIAGGALFVAGLIVGDDAGTVLAITGAAIGAYGLYLYFR